MINLLLTNITKFSRDVIKGYYNNRIAHALLAKVYTSTVKAKYSTIIKYYTKGKERGNSYRKSEEVSG